MKENKKLNTNFGKEEHDLINAISGILTGMPINPNLLDKIHKKVDAYGIKKNVSLTEYIGNIPKLSIRKYDIIKTYTLSNEEIPHYQVIMRVSENTKELVTLVLSADIKYSIHELEANRLFTGYYCKYLNIVNLDKVNVKVCGVIENKSECIQVYNRIKKYYKNLLR